MADESMKSPSSPAPFDVRTIKQLVGLMAQNDLSEIDLRDGEQRVRIRRGGRPAVTMAPTASYALPTASAPVAPTSAPATPSAPVKPSRNLLEIKSETVGTFYARPNPESPPYVSVGSRVTPSTVVCQIEAMKLYNAIESGVAGVIAELCVENAQPVEFGQVLFRVDPAG